VPKQPEFESGIPGQVDANAHLRNHRQPREGTIAMLRGWQRLRQFECATCHRAKPADAISNDLVRHRCQISGAVMPNNRNELAGSIENIVRRSVAAVLRCESIV
jgi:hypothetical protein